MNPLLVGVVAALAGSAITLAISPGAHRDAVLPPTQQEAAMHTDLRLADLLEMNPQGLAKMDIAEANLLCAKGLPGSENLDVKANLKTLDQWADAIYLETQRNWHRFKENPQEYENSEAYYKMGMLITVLQEDLGIRYNPDLIEVPDEKVNEAFLTNPSNMFLTGILGPKRMGTCSSMPVLYVAIARRLGYPVKLVPAKDHLFARWQGRDGSVYNIEGTGHGIALHTNDYYKYWRKIDDKDIQAGLSLKSLTASQELSIFLLTRAGALRYHNRLHEAVIAASAADHLWPENNASKAYLADIVMKMAPQGFGKMPPSSVKTIPAPEGWNPDPNIDPQSALENPNRIIEDIVSVEHLNLDWDLINRKSHTTPKVP